MDTTLDAAQIKFDEDIFMVSGDGAGSPMPKVPTLLKPIQEEKKKSSSCSSALSPSALPNTAQPQSQTPTKTKQRDRRKSSVTSMASHVHGQARRRDSHVQQGQKGNSRKEGKTETPPRPVTRDKAQATQGQMQSHTEQLEQVLYSRWLEGLRKRWEVDS